jgi:hypothetical protein
MNGATLFFSAKANEGYSVEAQSDKIVENHEVNARIKKILQLSLVTEIS